MGLFEKKNCAICGKEIGLLGTVKLEDGVMCKSCSGKLSPFFSGRKKTTVSEIEQQLAYREKNKAAVKTFSPDITLGNNTKVYVESGSGKFIVTAQSDWRSKNPDIITRNMVNSCDVEVKEHKDEIYDKDSEGNSVSYDPARYRYTYEFIMHIRVESPYFDEIKFELSKPNDRPEGADSYEYMDTAVLGRKIQAAIMPDKFSYRDGDEVVFTVDLTSSSTDSYAGSWKCSCGHVNSEGRYCSKCGRERSARWYCPDCGKENSGSFCTACGRRRPTD